MSCFLFLRDLFDHGRVTVPYLQEASVAAYQQRLESEGDAEADDGQALRNVLNLAEQIRRREMPGEPPEWNIETAVAAALWLYACATAYSNPRRTVEECVPAHVGIVLQRFAGSGTQRAQSSGQRSAETRRAVAAVHYSADLVLCYTPQLYLMTRRLSSADPLLAELKRGLQDWPLSAIGLYRGPDGSSDDGEVLPADTAAVIDSLLTDPALRMILLERAIQARDARLMKHKNLRAAVAEAAGMYVHEFGLQDWAAVAETET